MIPRPWPAQDPGQPASTPVVSRLLDLALSDAVRAGAHTIEFRLTDDSGLVLWDLNGTLAPYMQVPAEAHRLLLGRLVALIGFAPGAPGPHEGPLDFAGNGTAARLTVRVSTGADGRMGATVRVLEVTDPGHAAATT